jgi:hypothetical protein
MVAEEKLPKATHAGELKIGDMIIPCAVLEDGRRVLTQEGFLHAIGRARKAKAGTGASVDGMPAFLIAGNLQEFISKELIESTRAIRFRNLRGNKAYGYLAELLPRVCQVYLEANDARVLLKNQIPIAAKCEILVRGLAHVGIVALVDEATGYQYDRDRDDLERFLSIYLAAEHLKWAKMFPDEFFRQIYRLKRWPYPRGTSKRTPLIGKIINKIVFAKLPDKVLPKLRELNPVIRNDNRKITRLERPKFTHPFLDFGLSDSELVHI